MLDDFTPHQQRIIKNFYANKDKISLQRLSELVTELYLAEGKKQEKLWTTADGLMQKLNVPESRRTHILGKKDVTLLANLVKEIMSSG